MNSAERKMVLAAHAANPIRDYRTIYYGFVTPTKGGEFRLKVYAVNETKTYGIRATDILKAWSDRDYYQLKDVWFNYQGTPMVEFDEMKNRPHLAHHWYRGRWGARISWKNGYLTGEDYTRYVNLEALKETRYKYCAFESYSGKLSLVQYCRIFAKHKEAELLVKAGLSRLVSAGFLDRLAANKPLRDFFRANVEQIKRWGYSIPDIVTAHAHGWTLEKARRERRFARTMRGVPKGVDKHALAKWLKKNDIDLWDWLGYAAEVKEAGEDILEFGVTMPRDMHERRRRLQRQIKRRDAKRAKELKERRNAALAETAKRVAASLERMRAKLEERLACYEVVYPATQQAFAEEGKLMRNCIGGYFAACADGKKHCFFIRRNGKPVADVEATTGGKVVQCRGKCNKETPPEVEEFAAMVAKRIAAAARRKAA